MTRYTRNLAVIGLCLFFFCPAFGQNRWLDHLTIEPAHPSAGELFRVQVVTNPNIEAVQLRLQNSNNTLLHQFIGYARVYGSVKYWVITSVLPVTYADTLVHARLIISAGMNTSEASFNIAIAEHAFHAETIDFGKQMSNLKTLPDPQKTRESEELYRLLQQFDDSWLPETPGFILPLEYIRKTAFFGDRRIYAYDSGATERTLHYGVDFGGDRLPVRATAAGIVKFANRRIVTGNTVVIQHAPGIFSLHYHLSELKVRENQKVDQAELLGYSGATGLVTGPHLHWEIRCQGEAADPEALVAHEHIDTGSLSKLLSLPLLP